jgi:hypothetical protein
MLPCCTMVLAVLLPAPRPDQQSLSIWTWSLARRQEGARSAALTPARFFSEICAPRSTRSNTHSHGTVAWQTARWSAVLPCPSCQQKNRLVLLRLATCTSTGEGLWTKTRTFKKHSMTAVPLDDTRSFVIYFSRWQPSYILRWKHDYRNLTYH